MNRTLDLRGGSPLLLPLFAGLAATVIALGFLALEKSGAASVVVSAVTIDVVLVIPVLHYVMVVRGLGLPAITVLPVFRLSLVAAGMMLPAGERVLYDLLAHLARPAELAIAAYVLYRFYVGWRTFRSADTDDVLERYRTAVRAALPAKVPSVDRAAAAMAFEFALAWFATRAWRSRPQLPAGASAFPGHRRSGYGAVVTGLLMVLAIEVVAVHLLVSLWSATVAWILTALSAYGAVWILGDFQAVRLRPSWLGKDRFSMRLGLRWTLEVPRWRVRRARRLEPGESVEGALRMTLPNTHRILVELGSPATATGVYGIQRTVTAVELGVDDPDGFLLELGRGQATGPS